MFQIDCYAIARITAIKLQDNRWWVKRIDTNPPALLHGHNGCPLANARELHLALTRLRFIAAMVVKPEDYARIIPGIGPYNDGWIDYVETLIQFDDPDRRFLIGSHFARLKNQQKISGIHFSQSSKFITRELNLSIYDKLAEVRHGIADPPGSWPTRVEAIYRNETRLAKDVLKTRLFTGKSGPLVATMAPAAACALVQLTLSRLTGYGWLPEVDSLKGLPKPARMIAAALGHAIYDPHRLDLALENYRLVEDPGMRTMQKVESMLRAYAVSNYIGDPQRIIFPDLTELPRADVRWPEREREFGLLMRDIAAPSEPDPDIAAAWSQTRFLPAAPEIGALFGSVAPAPPPFRTHTL
jgi:hypothetical protein